MNCCFVPSFTKIESSVDGKTDWETEKLTKERVGVWGKGDEKQLIAESIVE